MDLHRIRLGNAVFEGRNNAYLLRGDRTTLVDPGASLDSVRDDLHAGLAAAGVEAADVDQILLTHWHADHAGLAGELAAESGATVRAHEADAPRIAGDEDALAAERERRERRFDEWGLPAEKRAELVAFLDRHDDLQGEAVEVETLSDGDRVVAGDAELEVVHLPGHAAGLVGFAAETDDGEEAFVGDAILPKYTPNVGGADLAVDAPLERYVESLVRLMDRNLDRAWPGHRDPIEDPTARARTILEHHRDRTERVVSVLRERGTADPWTVSADLFGELEEIHILHGPGEAFAHLDHLVRRGVAERTGEEYRLSESDPNVADLFPNTKY
ncbi:MBL fold metallo-hydrolase [Halopelagius longus]|nr:MBL fold metallo-hydrolase [Halopelagius longus]RDI73006.1 MBL fold metallo-hydrolase [Halopelagius longus]